ncbi:hypothetical protein ACPTIU_30145, partial [Pseudomonas aeruginosa]|uniref:hypothetical protein n=1 Tax=Pseudomonas aeruginosa TaxID=287 RepID=UPI003CC665CB
ELTINIELKKANEIANVAGFLITVSNFILNFSKIPREMHPINAVVQLALIATIIFNKNRTTMSALFFFSKLKYSISSQIC